jgi:hypothetical protein
MHPMPSDDYANPRPSTPVKPQEHDDLYALQQTLSRLVSNKPNDRSPKDRHYAVMITDLEKIIAYYRYFIP